MKITMRLCLLILFSLLLLVMTAVTCSSQDVVSEPEPELPDYIAYIDVSEASTKRGKWHGGAIEFILPIDYKLELALRVDVGDVVFTVTDYWNRHKLDEVVSKGERSIFSVTAKQNGEVYRCYFNHLPEATDYQKRIRKAYLYYNVPPKGWK